MAEDSTSVSVRQQRLGIPEVRPISDALKVDKTKVRCSLRAARREPHCLGLNLQDEHYIITQLKKSRNAFKDIAAKRHDRFITAFERYQDHSWLHFRSTIVEPRLLLLFFFRFPCNVVACIK
jgi:hypothetical protein